MASQDETVEVVAEPKQEGLKDEEMKDEEEVEVKAESIVGDDKSAKDAAEDHCKEGDGGSRYEDYDVDKDNRGWDEENTAGASTYGQAVEPEAPEESDAVADERKKIPTGSIMLDRCTATPNAMVTAGGRLLMTLCDGGLQYLYAGVRANVGVKSGRYAFDIKIVETMSPDEGRVRQGVRMPMPRQLVRVGFTTSLAACPILDDSAEKVYFDSEGNYAHMRDRQRAATRFSKDNVITVVLNLDASSPNKNTVSLFRDGQRSSKPMKLPEGWVGKTLFPAITYKNVTVQVNFGPSSMQALPFRCRMLQEAAVEDVELDIISDGAKREVIFPIGLPDQGLFDYLDEFLQAHPKYFELSDRKVLDWARKSLIFRQRGYFFKETNDKPGMNFSIPYLDDESIQKALWAIAPVLGRDLVHMELKANLVAAERQVNLKRYPPSSFRRVAIVAIGEPPEEHKARAREMMLADKIRRAEAEKKRQAANSSQNWSKDNYAQGPPKKRREEGDGEAREAEDEAEKEEAKAGEEEELHEDVEKPIELTDEEKALWWRRVPAMDLSKGVLSSSFASFSMPTKEEGFDEVRYVWQNEPKAALHLKEWVLAHKKTLRVDELKPSEWFKDQYAAWQKQLADWRARQVDAKSSKSKDSEKKDGEDPAKEGSDNEEVEDKAEFQEDEVDVSTLEDVNEMGNGKPVYINFEYEDWTLLSLRYELHLLLLAFKKDLDDPDRPSFPEQHLGFYYRKYFDKHIDLECYGCKNVEDLVVIIKETLGLDSETKLLQMVLPGDAPFDKFMRITEEHRRERQFCIDAGDETARLRFTRPQSRHQGGHQGGSYGGHSGQQGGYSGHQQGGYSGHHGGGHSSGYGGRSPAPLAPSRGGFSGGSGAIGRESYNRSGGSDAYGSRSGGGSADPYGRSGVGGGGYQSRGPPPARGYGGPPPVGASSGMKRSYPPPPPAASSYPPPASKYPRSAGGYSGGSPPASSRHGGGGGSRDPGRASSYGSGGSSRR